MEKDKAILILLVVLLIGVILIGGYYVFFYNSNEENKESLDKTGKGGSENCLERGCPEGSFYIGSKNSNKYYECGCRYASNIKPENIICFSSEDDAEARGYIKTEC